MPCAVTITGAGVRMQSASASTAFSCIIAANGRLKWEPESDTAETWTPQADTIEVWSAVSGGSTSWTPQADTDEIWTPVADTLEIWTNVG